MRRFYSEEPNDDDDFNIHDEEYEMMNDGSYPYSLGEEHIIGAMQFEIAEQEMNFELMSKSIDVASSSFFWKFKSSKSKLKDIELIYNELKRIREEED